MINMNIRVVFGDLLLPAKLLLRIFVCYMNIDVSLSGLPLKTVPKRICKQGVSLIVKKYFSRMALLHMRASGVFLVGVALYGHIYPLDCSCLIVFWLGSCVSHLLQHHWT